MHMPTKIPAENAFLVAVRRGNTLKLARIQTRNGRNNAISDSDLHKKISTHAVLAAESVNTADKRASIRTSYDAIPRSANFMAVDFQ